MLIKCPDCGEEYSYGRKICHKCKCNSIHFGRIFENGQKEYKWNCNVAMACFELMENELESLESVIDKTVDSSELEMKVVTHYEWNCDTAIRFNNHIQINKRKINFFPIYE